MNRLSLALMLGFLALTPAISEAQGMGGGNSKDMATIHELLGQNKLIKRKVTKLKDGVETLTESKDPEVARLIQEHAFAMQKRMKEGRRIRQWDPLFAELFDHHTLIAMTVTKTKQGVTVKETSKDPYAVTLIQWHAEGVTGFVKEGMAGMHKEHPAPPKPKAVPRAAFLGMGDGITTCPVTGEPIVKSVSAEIQGKTVYFCCAGCIETVQKDPSRYLKWAKQAKTDGRPNPT